MNPLKIATILGAMLSCCCCSADDTVKGEFYFHENGTAVSYRNEDGKQQWRFELPQKTRPSFMRPGRPGRSSRDRPNKRQFTNSNSGRSRVIVDGEFVLITDQATAHALDLKTGKAM